jgi:uncharacterized protein YgfB (UPF0149 family)
MLVFNMKQITLPNYEELSAVLGQTAQKLHASQVHGLIAGMLCGQSAGKGMVEALIKTLNDNEAAQSLLQQLYQASDKQLKEFLFELELMLPADTTDLPERAEALTLWCQGFLIGLKKVNIQTEGRKPSELTEAIDDIIEIANMNYEVVVSSEEDEVAYVELVEYVRMAVIFIYQEMYDNSGARKKISKTTNLH